MAPKAGDRVVIHWSGYTSGYQASPTYVPSVLQTPSHTCSHVCMCEGFVSALCRYKATLAVVHCCLQGKRIENTSARDEPFTFVLGKDEVGHYDARSGISLNACQLTFWHTSGEEIAIA